jgi:type III secretion protein L
MAKVLKATPTGVKREGRPLAVSEQPFDPKVEAERILAEANKEAERLRSQAAAEGRERGLAAVTELLVAARASAARSQRNVETDLRKLAVRIAERILERELTTNPETVVDIAAAALRQAGAPRDVLLRVHPDDLKALERGRPRLLERCARAEAVQFRADPTIGRGGCIVETELGTVDARLPVQLDAIERALRGAGGGA